MAVTARALIASGFGDNTKDNIEFCFYGFDYLYSIPDQSLYFINDGFGEPEFIERYTTVESLLDALESLTGYRDPDDLRNF